MTYAEELRVKRARVADALRRIGGLAVEVPPVLGADSMVRNKATLPFGVLGGRVTTGFYAGGSRRLVPHPAGCALYPPVFRVLADAACSYAQAHGLRAGERGRAAPDFAAPGRNDRAKFQPLCTVRRARRLLWPALRGPCRPPRRNRMRLRRAGTGRPAPLFYSTPRN